MSFELHRAAVLSLIVIDIDMTSTSRFKEIKIIGEIFDFVPQYQYVVFFYSTIRRRF